MQTPDTGHNLQIPAINYTSVWMKGNTPSLMSAIFRNVGNNPNAVNALEANKHCSMLTGAFALQFCPMWLKWQHVSFTGPLRDQSYISQRTGLQSDWNMLVCSQMITYNTWHLEMWNCHSIEQGFQTVGRRVGQGWVAQSHLAVAKWHSHSS